MSRGKGPLGGADEVKVAIVQTPPVFMDLSASVKKACSKIQEAADAGAKLVVFSEAWLTGYPYWDEGWNTDMACWAAVREKFYDNALVIPSDEFDQLSAAARDNGAIVVIGCNELDERPEKHTIYNTLLYIGSDGTLIGKHRKLRPTYVEAAFWGPGPGDDLYTYPTEIGRLGGLICSEHTMTTVRARMIEQGEDFHVAVYPGAFDLVSGPKLEVMDESGSFFPGYASARAHAIEGGCYVLLALGYLEEKTIPEDFPLRDALNIAYARGGSMIIGPAGVVIAGPVYGDQIIYANCKAKDIKLAKAVIDTNGTYSRPDLLTLEYHPR
ncbi:MAG: carbon-nitrogen hydrolase family protein [Acidothermus cellulolyticus]|jgi:nitrilase|nr:carbon-nitrogen hydrolase family protein [Acidothermus cellulolyticus]